MHGRGLRADVRRDIYGCIIDAKPVGDKGALRSASGPRAMTAYEAEMAFRRKPCRIFKGSAESDCGRCGHAYAAHRRPFS